MAQIIPAILAESFEDAQGKVHLVAPYTNWVQLDVSDGIFAPTVTWGEPELIRELGGVSVEVHLMVQKPEEILPLWLDSGAKRIYIHYEATQEHEKCLSLIRGAGMEAGIALLQKTPVDVLEPFEKLLDAVLIFDGELGEYGGTFHEEILEKISTLRRNYADLTIEVDGGMNPESARKVVEVGADAVVAGSFIFGSKNPQAAIEELQEATD